MIQRPYVKFNELTRDFHYNTNIRQKHLIKCVLLTHVFLKTSPETSKRLLGLFEFLKEGNTITLREEGNIIC